MRCDKCGNKLVKKKCDLVSYELTCKSCGFIIKKKDLEKIFMKSKGNKILGFIFIIIGLIIAFDNFKEQNISNLLDIPIELFFLGSFGTILIIIGAFSIIGKINLLKHLLYSYHIRTNSKFQR